MPYSDLYDIVVPRDNILRQINELVNFQFIFDELKDNYCLDNGRKAYDPIMMFKYFLGLMPEDKVIEASSLCKFRKQRLKNMDLLNILIQKSIDIAVNKGITESKPELVSIPAIKENINHIWL